MVLLFLFLSGLCLGSFANVLVDRGQKNKSLNGRSQCDFCHYQLQWFDNIPVLSWFFLGGKCRKCGKKLSVQYPIIELLMGLFFLLSAIEGGMNSPFWGKEEMIKTFFFTFFSFLFLVIAIWDWKYMLIPDNLVWLGIVMAFLKVLSIVLLEKNCAWSGWECAFPQAFLGGLVVFGFFFLMFQFSSGHWIGEGDVKLGFLIGVLAGLKDVYWLLMLAYLSGALVAVFLLLKKKKKMNSRLPFGPFLLFASFVLLLWGEEIGDLTKFLF